MLTMFDLKKGQPFINRETGQKVVFVEFRKSKEGLLQPWFQVAPGVQMTHTDWRNKLGPYWTVIKGGKK